MWQYYAYKCDQSFMLRILLEINKKQILRRPIMVWSALISDLVIDLFNDQILNIFHNVFDRDG